MAPVEEAEAAAKVEVEVEVELAAEVVEAREGTMPMVQSANGNSDLAALHGPLQRLAAELATSHVPKTSQPNSSHRTVDSARRGAQALAQTGAVESHAASTSSGRSRMVSFFKQQARQKASQEDATHTAAKVGGRSTSGGKGSSGLLSSSTSQRGADDHTQDASRGRSRSYSRLTRTAAAVMKRRGMPAASFSGPL